MVELEEGLLVGEAAHEGCGGCFVAEEADGAAFDFLVGGGVAEFVVVFEGAALFVDGERDEMVCGEFEGEVFSEYGNGGFATG